MLKDRISALQTLLHSRHILGTVAELRGLVDEHSSANHRQQVINELSDSLSVQMAGMDLIRIDYKSDRAAGMKETLEVVRQQFIEQLLAPERSSMEDSSYFLADNLKHRQEELDKAEATLAEFKDRHAAELPALHVTNITRLAQLKQRLSERQAELAGAQKSLGGLDQQLSKTNPVLGRIEEQIVRIRGELALLRARYTDRHSKVRAALRKLERLEHERQNLLAKTNKPTDTNQLWDIATSSAIANAGVTQTLLISQMENLQLARGKVDALTEETQSLKAMIETLEKQTNGFGAHEQKLGKLERDLKVKRELYENLLERYEMAKVTGSLSTFEQEKRIKIIDRPYTPTAPANLPVILFVVAGLFGGVLLGCGMALVFELTDSTVRRREQLQLLTSAPVFSRLPPIRNVLQ